MVFDDLEKRLIEYAQSDINARDFIQNALFPAVERSFQMISDSDNVSVTLGHLADADGLGFTIGNKSGHERIARFLGATKDFISHRIMSFSNDSENVDSLEKIFEAFGEDCDWNIGDLSTLNPEVANNLLVNGAIIYDHHKTRGGKFNDNFTVVNPENHGIDGGLELSASMIQAYELQLLYSKVKKDVLSTCLNKKDEKKVKSELGKLKNDIDYISIFLLAGANADRQSNEGLNSVMYDYLEDLGLISQLDNNFYGYFTKSLTQILSEPIVKFNLEYRICEKQELNWFLENSFNKIDYKNGEFVDKIFNDYKYAFVAKVDPHKKGDEKYSIGLNLPYIQSLSLDEVQKFNNYFKELTGDEVVEIEEVDDDVIYEIKNIKSSTFSHHTDDIKTKKNRLLHAETILRDLGVAEPAKTTLANEKRIVGMLKKKFHDNLIAFSPKEELDFNLNKLYQSQYAVNVNRPLLKKITIPELGNMMTAMSKQREGDLLMEIIENETSDGLDSVGLQNEAKLKYLWQNYKTTISEMMGLLEKRILSEKCSTNIEDHKTNLIRLNDNIYYLNVDFLNNVAKESNILPETMNGVIIGIAAQTSLLPDSYAIVFSGCSSQNDAYKISARVTDCFQLQDVKINKLMEKLGGGGHNLAAATKISKHKMEKFLTLASSFNYLSGDIK